jgi:hypothetical protein
LRGNYQDIPISFSKRIETMDKGELKFMLFSTINWRKNEVPIADNPRRVDISTEFDSEYDDEGPAAINKPAELTRAQYVSSFKFGDTLRDDVMADMKFWKASEVMKLAQKITHRSLTISDTSSHIPLLVEYNESTVKNTLGLPYYNKKYVIEVFKDGDNIYDNVMSDITVGRWTMEEVRELAQKTALGELSSANIDVHIKRLVLYKKRIDFEGVDYGGPETADTTYTANSADTANTADIANAANPNSLDALDGIAAGPDGGDEPFNFADATAVSSLGRYWEQMGFQRTWLGLMPRVPPRGSIRATLEDEFRVELSRLYRKPANSVWTNDEAFRRVMIEPAFMYPKGVKNIGAGMSPPHSPPMKNRLKTPTEAPGAPMKPPRQTVSKRLGTARQTIMTPTEAPGAPIKARRRGAVIALPPPSVLIHWSDEKLRGLAQARGLFWYGGRDELLKELEVWRYNNPM